MKKKLTSTIQNFFITYNVGHGAGTKISAKNIGPGAVGYNNNRGPGAGGCNSGENSGAVNCRNWEGNQVGGGSKGRVQTGRFDQHEYFFCRFSDSYDEKRFEEIFSGCGTVSSIYIPKRKDKYGNRFGFVTFLELPDEGGLKKLDESHEFKVNRARPRRRTIRNRMKTEGNMRKSFGTGFSGCMWVPKQGHVAVERRDKTKIIEFKTKKEEKAWLDFCAVGRIRELKDILPRVRRYLHEQGFSFCKATHFHLGDDYVLLQCTNHDDLSTLLNKGRDLLRRLFHWIKPWSPNVGEESQERYAYLRFEGAPPHAWTEGFFRKAVDQMRGGFISMDDSTINKTELHVGRVLITTASNDNISESFTVLIDSNDYYNVRVIEETYGNSAPVDPDWDISVHDGMVVDGRLDVEQSNGDSSDKGFQENVGREPHKYQRELGSQKVVSSTNTLNTGAKPLWPTKKLTAEGNPFRPANRSCPLICNGKEVSDKESAVVNGRSEGELSDGSLGKGDERERRDEEIFTRNRISEFNGNSECNVQTALQTCSLGSKQDGCWEGDREIGSSDQGFQEIIVTSQPQKDHPGESGPQNFGSDTSRTVGNGDAGVAGSRDLMVEGNINALYNFRSAVGHYQCQKEISIVRKRDAPTEIANGNGSS